MAFGRAPRDQFHLTGSDDPFAPDYVKLPPLRAPSKAAKGDRGSGPQGKEQLPRMPLKVTKMRYRPMSLTRELKDGGSALVGDLMESVEGSRAHPLDSFSKPAKLRYSGKQRVEDGEMAKITALPYNAEESVLERRLAYKGGKASKLTNQGLGRAIFCEEGSRYPT